MARLQNPQNNRDAIRQDYQDKHASDGGAVLVCRKYDRQVKDKNRKPQFDTAGNPITYKNWYEAKSKTKNEETYIKNSYDYSEKRKNDCYCTLNNFLPDCEPDIKETKTGQSVSYRSVNKLGYLTGFYLDFDHVAIHALAKKQQASAELVQEVLGYSDIIIQTLEDYFPGDYGMPVISYTGGGYGFYIKLKPIAATPENKALYMSIWELLYHRFSILFEGLLDVFDNDHSVLDLVRVIRITGTYNSKTGTFSRFVARYGNAAANEVYEYSLDEIIELYQLGDITVDISQEKKEVTHSPLQIKEKEKEEKKEHGSKKSAKELNYTKKGNIAYPSKWYQGYCNAKQIGRYLALAIKSLAYLDGQETLQRNNALFLAACLKTELEYAKCGEGSFYKHAKISKVARQAVLEFVLELNDSLTTPIEDEELANLVKSALSNLYHFRKKATIQKFLNLTDEEFANLGWLDKQKAEQQKKERNNELTDLDREVIKLYLDGWSDAKIAEELHISKRTSIRIRQRLGVTDRNIKFETIDFDGNKRHLRYKTGYDTPEMRQIANTPLFEGSELTYGDFLDKPSMDLTRYLKSECAQLGMEKIRSIYRDFMKKRYEYNFLKNMQTDWEDNENIPCIDPAYNYKLVSFGDSEIKNTMELWRIRGTS